jgi:hypothetical protein
MSAWVISGKARSEHIPSGLPKADIVMRSGTSDLCQEATYAVQQTALLFDHIVCALLEKSSLPCSLDCAE